ncbi:hypothetical protein I3760_10G117700 [Carya illinoinensis]|nr:hypothetical protein I3760_10G117700 [Carya illinoinensis]
MPSSGVAVPPGPRRYSVSLVFGDASAYQTWAANKLFVVGEILLFNFITNVHDVLQVPKESYDSCSSSNPISDTFTTGLVNITLSTNGTHYYICTFGRHCLSGQKLSVIVLSFLGGVPPTSTSTPPSTPITPTTPSPISGTPVGCAPTPASSLTPTPGTMSPPNSSSSGGFASLFIFLLSITMGFLF